jgi:hypothetical protein
MSPSERLQELGKDHKNIAADWNPQPNGGNVQAMRNTYSRLRATLERIVEKELLAGVVSRFESQIVVGRIDEVIGIAEQECKEMRRLIGRCHEVTEAHDPPPGKQASVPDPTELASDIASTEQLLKTIKARRKAAREKPRQPISLHGSTP